MALKTIFSHRYNTDQHRLINGNQCGCNNCGAPLNLKEDNCSYCSSPLNTEVKVAKPIYEGGFDLAKILGTSEGGCR